MARTLPEEQWFSTRYSGFWHFSQPGIGFDSPPEVQ
jgi:hypothetical protein